MTGLALSFVREHIKAGHGSSEKTKQKLEARPKWPRQRATVEFMLAGTRITPGNAKTLFCLLLDFQKTSLSGLLHTPYLTNKEGSV